MKQELTVQERIGREKDYMYELLIENKKQQLVELKAITNPKGFWNRLSRAFLSFPGIEIMDIKIKHIKEETSIMNETVERIELIKNGVPTKLQAK